MQQVSNILVILETDIETPVQDQPAVKRGLFLAEKLNAKLFLFATVYNEYLSGHRFYKPEVYARERSEQVAKKTKELKNIVDRPDNKSLKVEYHAAWAYPYYDSLIKHATEIGADLVIKDSPYHKHFNRAFLSSNDWRLIHECPVPLLLVRSEQWHDQPPVIAAVDPAHEHDKTAILDHKILGIAQTMANACASQLHVFHSYPNTTSGFGLIASVNYMPQHMPTNNQNLEAWHGALLADLLSSYHVPDQQIHLLCGSVRSQLRQLVQNLNAGMVVMGALSRSRFDNLFLGLTAEKLLNTLPCDMLIVRSEPAL